MIHNRKSTPEMAKRIVQLKSLGVSPKNIAIRMGLGSASRVYQILREHEMEKRK